MKITPAMAQYYEIKKHYTDAILFFRMGDFYEMFEEDAEIAHSILGINLTSRNKNAENPIPLAGIPFHAKDKYLPQLLKAGYKVAIAEQISDPNLKGIVKREVTRVVTPGTHILEESENTIDTQKICAIVNTGKTFGLSVIDLLLQNWFCSEFNSFEDLSKKLYKISPSEIILPKNLFTDSNIYENITQKYTKALYQFNSTHEAKTYLLQKLGISSFGSIGIENRDSAIQASSLLLQYLEYNQKIHSNIFSKLRFESFSGYVEIDEATLKSLDILYNFSVNSSKHGTLFSAINNTHTQMGKRYLQEALLHPSIELKEIQKRQDFISFFAKNPRLLEALGSKIKNLSDLDALIAKISLKRVSPKDLVSVKKSLLTIKEIGEDIRTVDENVYNSLFC